MNLHRILLSVASMAAMVVVCAPASAQTGDIRIAHIYSKTGPLEAYAKQTQTGLLMGLDYATGGTMRVNGRKIVILEKDDQGKPDVGKSLLAAAYATRRSTSRSAPHPARWPWRCCRWPRNTRRC